jgi:hypothetical protein
MMAREWGAASISESACTRRVRTCHRRDRAMYSTATRNVHVCSGHQWRGWRGSGAPRRSAHLRALHTVRQVLGAIRPCTALQHAMCMYAVGVSGVGGEGVERRVGRRICVLSTRSDRYSARSGHVQHCNVAWYVVRQVAVRWREGRWCAAVSGHSARSRRGGACSLRDPVMYCAVP